MSHSSESKTSGNIATNRLKIGLIGFGSWPKQSYVPILMKRDDTEIISVAASTVNTLDMAKSIIGSQVETYTSFQKLLNDSKIDAVFIGLPNQITSSAIEAAISKKLHVFVEPPFKENQSIRHYLRGASPVFHVDLELTHLPIVEFINNIISENQVGIIEELIVTLQCNWGNTWAIPPSEEKEKVLEISTWYMDMVHYLSNKKVDYVTWNTECSNYLKGEVIIKYKDSYKGVWNYDFDSSEAFSVKINIKGKDVNITGDMIKGLLNTEIKGSCNSYNIPANNPDVFTSGMNESIESFINAICSGNKTKTDYLFYSEIVTIQNQLRSQN